jgi:Protein of unknown function (DUF1186)
VNANDVMEDLSRKHKRFPKAALSAAVTMRSDVAPLMLEELKRLLAAFDASLDAPTEQEHKVKMKEAVKPPSPLFYGFFLAAEWKQKEVFRPFAELLGWREAMLPNLLSEAVVSEDVASRILAQFYDGDPLSIFKLLMDRYASGSVRFWQWRTLIRVTINNEIDHDTLRSLLTRAFDDLEQERNLMVWSGSRLCENVGWVRILMD